MSLILIRYCKQQVLVEIGLKCQTKSQLTFETNIRNILSLVTLNQGRRKIFIDSGRPFSLAELEVMGDVY